MYNIAYCCLLFALCVVPTHVSKVPMIIMLPQVADYTRVFWRAELREGLQKL